MNKKTNKPQGAAVSAVKINTDAGYLMISPDSGGYYSIEQVSDQHRDADYGEEGIRVALLIGDRQALKEMGEALIKLAKGKS